MKILAFAGSMRAGSFNRKLLQAGIDALRPQAEIDHLDLRDLALPLYDGDLEEKEGLPAGAKAFKTRIAAAQGILLATPEYNHSVPGTLKNAIDWASRPPDNPFRGKVVLLMGASPGQFGAVRGIAVVRASLIALFAHVLPQTVMLARADQGFDAEGRLADPKVKSQVEKACAELVRVTRLMNAG